MASKLEAARGQIECTPVSPVPVIASDARFRRNGRAARQCVLPSTVREPRHTTRCRLRTERDASIDFSAVCGTVVECTPSNVRRGLPGKTANTVLSWETRLVDTVPSTGFPLGIVEERSRVLPQNGDDRGILRLYFQNLINQR